MNFQQLEYILAVEKEGHFGRAAKACFVTQPTLSMMIAKLEQELDIIIFDRSKQPIVPTNAGKEIIQHARQIIVQRDELFTQSNHLHDRLEGEFSLGIIPTIAPYLLPLFLQDFTKHFGQIKLVIQELTTAEILEKIHQGELDYGLLATPLRDRYIIENVLYYEELFFYGPPQSKPSEITLSDIDMSHLILLKEGHCLRNQGINLCDLREASIQNINYEIGSLETIKALVDQGVGYTFLPELAIRQLTKKQKSKIHPIRKPSPVREVSLIHHHTMVHKAVANALITTITNNLPRYIKKRSDQLQVLDI